MSRVDDLRKEALDGIQSEIQQFEGHLESQREAIRQKYRNEKADETCNVLMEKIQLASGSEKYTSEAAFEADAKSYLSKMELVALAKARSAKEKAAEKIERKIEEFDKDNEAQLTDLLEAEKSIRLGIDPIQQFNTLVNLIPRVEGGQITNDRFLQELSKLRRRMELFEHYELLDEELLSQLEKFEVENKASLNTAIEFFDMFDRPNLSSPIPIVKKQAENKLLAIEGRKLLIGLVHSFSETANRQLVNHSEQTLESTSSSFSSDLSINMSASDDSTYATNNNSLEVLNPNQKAEKISALESLIRKKHEDLITLFERHYVANEPELRRLNKKIEKIESEKLEPLLDKVNRAAISPVRLDTPDLYNKSKIYLNSRRDKRSLKSNYKKWIVLDKKLTQTYADNARNLEFDTSEIMNELENYKHELMQLQESFSIHQSDNRKVNLELSSSEDKLAASSSDKQTTYNEISEKQEKKPNEKMERRLTRVQALAQQFEEFQATGISPEKQGIVHDKDKKRSPKLR